ncbi:hypothetical protein [Roseibium salinum]|uniref:Uncharacterized protein n=1 Tax=Roseibium salinum TaxID=1604349 RepID=A0ABT3R7A1_9HYPH|nr:hypothetical protein [Roseibium sp. DSM 29163]MCX2724946.1 hypothetical protein [Roseibium sp. DSM 29163]MDN3721124.1 hypothetical protein [Roseibium salinum]
MQVRPVSAIHPLRIRPKPVTAPASQPDMNAASGTRFSDIGMVPAYIAAEVLRRDARQGAHAEYATQLLADRYAEERSWLERQRHLAQYASAAEEEDRFCSYSVSI